MSQELSFDLLAWWEEQSFPGKELFKLDETGALILGANNNIKERQIATVTSENKDIVIKTLCEKFAAVEGRINEMEVEWVATEDKLKLADKVSHLKDYLNHANALGDFLRPAMLVHDWEHTIYQSYEAHYAEKLKLAELAESLAESTQFKETALAFKDITEKWKNAGQLDRTRNEKLWARIEDARKAFMERKRKHHEDEEKDLLHNLDLKIDLVEQAESLANSTEWKKTTETFHRLTDEWKSIGHTLNKKNEELWQRFLAAKSAFFERKRAHSAQVQAEQEQNYAVKLALVEKAEALKESKEWNVATQKYAELMDEWKKTGRVHAEKSDELWKRFTEARDHFFSAKRSHTEGIRTEHEQNFNLKQNLLNRAEKIKNSTHWSDTTNEMNDLMEEWKKVGHAGKQHNDSLWEQFIAARKHFFARKDASREQRKQMFESQKEARLEQAKGFVIKLANEIEEEKAKLLDFEDALKNITPGKKADELKTHLEKLIAEGNQKIKRLHEKLAASKDELEDRQKAEAAAPKEKEKSDVDG
jgi:hypothetical protein